MKVALVTGANKGIGFEIAKQLLQNNVFVYLGSRNLKALWLDRKNILDLGDITKARGVEMYLPLWLSIYGATKNGAFIRKVVEFLNKNETYLPLMPTKWFLFFKNQFASV